MKGFRFTLENVLELRKREEEAIRADLAERTTREDEARRRAEARRVRLSVLLDAARAAKGEQAVLDELGAVRE